MGKFITIKINEAIAADIENEMSANGFITSWRSDLDGTEPYIWQYYRQNDEYGIMVALGYRAENPTQIYSFEYEVESPLHKALGGHDLRDVFASLHNQSIAINL